VRHVIDKRCIYGAGTHGPPLSMVENRRLTDPAEIEQALRFGEYIKQETLALYSLRKYRHLKQRYGLPPSHNS